MEALVIGFSGKIGSGKSTLSKIISEQLNISRVSFGDYVRIEALKEGLNYNRLTLQELGAKLIEKDLEKFCFDVIHQNNWNKNNSLIIDGIRHLQVLEVIMKIVKPLELKLIYIDIDYETRVNRLQSTNLKNVDLHSTELQVENKLRDKADLIIDGNKSVDQIKDKILKWVLSSR